MTLRTRWALTILVFAAVIAAVVIVAGSGARPDEDSQSLEAQAVEEANREGRIAITQDQAPHEARLEAGRPLLVGVERAITADVRSRIAHGQLTGPLQSVRCTATGRPRAGRRPFRCTARSAGIEYPFLAVVAEPARTLTWCKVDPPSAVNGPLEVPVSPRCRA